MATGRVVRSFFLALAIVTVPVVLSACGGDDPIFETESGRALFRDLLRAGSFGMVPTERSAFVIDRGDGSFTSMLWPASQGRLRETFRGPIPAGTQAIIHTHPLQWPMPSGGDVQEAARLGVPIYVLTPRAIYRTDHSQIRTILRDEPWFRPSFDRVHHSRCE